MSSFHVYAGHTEAAAAPVVRKIGFADVTDALRLGFDDFKAMPSHLVFLGFLYPFCGLVLASVSSYRGALQFLFPLASGFALVGPFAAIGLYELSRRREQGQPTDLADALNVVRSPSIPSIAALGVGLMLFFLLWLTVAHELYAVLFGDEVPASLGGFFQEILTTSRGWTLIIAGCLIGFAFSVVAICVTVVSFPLLLDRDAGLAMAVATSTRVVRENPLPIAFWGLIVAGALVLGSLPLFVGLAVVVPVLGHATWRLYRKLVARDPSQEHPVDEIAVDWTKATQARVKPHSFLFPETPEE